MGKKSRTPSVEARVVDTKQRAFGSLENVLLLVYLSFTFSPFSSFFSFLFLFSFSLFFSFLVFLLYYSFVVFLTFLLDGLVFFWCSAFLSQRVVIHHRTQHNKHGPSSRRRQTRSRSRPSDGT
jgi:hypothetical protein